MKAWIRNLLEGWLPEHLNGSLRPLKRRVVEAWASYDPEFELRMMQMAAVRRALRTRPSLEASPGVLIRLQNLIKSAPTAALSSAGPFPWKSWSLGMAFILLSMLISWKMMPPGNRLSWTIDGESATLQYQILRATSGHGEQEGASDFVLVRELPSKSGIRSYTFLDLSLIPGQSYIYLVRGVDQGGNIITSEPLVMPSSSALIGQLALIFSALAAGYGISLLARFESVVPRRHQFI